MTPKKLVIIWARFGPYHLSRIDSARINLRDIGWEVVGLEVAKKDLYEWKYIESRPLDKTIFTGLTYEELTRREIRKGVYDALSSINPNAVAINGWAVSEALAALSWCNRYKRIPILMSESHENSRNIFKEIVKRYRVRKYSSALVGGSQHRKYLENLGFNKKKIFLGYDVVDNDYFMREGMKARSCALSLRKKYHLPDRYFYCNTRFIKRKNIDTLLIAYSRYLKDKRNNRGKWNLVISGNGKMENAWKELANSLGLQKYISWVGFIQYEELPIFYGLASGFVHIPVEEAWGLVLNEATSSGLPIIASETTGSVSELVINHRNGRTVNPLDIDDVESALKEISYAGHKEIVRMRSVSLELAKEMHPRIFGSGLREALNVSENLSN